MKYLIFFLFLTNKIQAQINTNQTINIPVLFHVVYDERKSKCDEQGANKEQNLSRDLILAELQNLHDDFLLLNTDTDQVLPRYKSIIANPRINFYLDTVYKTGGQPGIIRTNNDHHLAWNKASPIINPKKYLNVYIVNYTHSYTVNDHVWSDSTTDAIYLYYCWVGRNYRLLTHETGHWLGLLHLWGTGTGKGDKNSCTVGDSITDTPPQRNATNIPCDFCPDGENGVIDQTCGTGPSNYNNFMDYSGCRKMFTVEQVRAMRINLFLHRATMVTNSQQN